MEIVEAATQQLGKPPTWKTQSLNDSLMFLFIAFRQCDRLVWLPNIAKLIADAQLIIIPKLPENKTCCICKIIRIKKEKKAIKIGCGQILVLIFASSYCVIMADLCQPMANNKLCFRCQPLGVINIKRGTLQS